MSFFKNLRQGFTRCHVVICLYSAFAAVVKMSFFNIFHIGSIFLKIIGLITNR